MRPRQDAAFGSYKAFLGIISQYRGLGSITLVFHRNLMCDRFRHSCEPHVVRVESILPHLRFEPVPSGEVNAGSKRRKFISRSGSEGSSTLPTQKALQLIQQLAALQDCGMTMREATPPIARIVQSENEFITDRGGLRCASECPLL